MAALKNIYRYPVKGLSAQPLTRVELEAGKPFRTTASSRWRARGARSTADNRNGPRRACS